MTSPGMKKIPKGATMHRTVWADGAGEEIRNLQPISYSAFEAMVNDPTPPAQMPSVLSDQLPDGEYWLIDGKWVPA